MLVSPFTILDNDEAPILVILQLSALVAREPVCLDLQAQWPLKGPVGQVSGKFFTGRQSLRKHVRA